MSLITEFALRNSRLTILAVLFFVLGGVLTFLNYPSREDPSIVIRQAQVSARFPGMATLRVEQLITRKLEEKIREIPEVKHIVSDSKTGVSLISITLRDDVVALDVPVGGHLGGLPELDQVVVGRVELAEGPVLLGLVVVDADAGVEACLPGFGEGEAGIGGDEAVDRLRRLDSHES